jgi:hypothetical protein
VGVDAQEHLRAVPEHVGDGAPLAEVGGSLDHVGGGRVAQAVRAEPGEAGVANDDGERAIEGSGASPAAHGAS